MCDLVFVEAPKKPTISRVALKIALIAKKLSNIIPKPPKKQVNRWIDPKNRIRKEQKNPRILKKYWNRLRSTFC